MTTTMLYTTGVSMEEPAQGFAPTTVGSGKPRHRPKALQIQPLDPNELSAKLDNLLVENDGQPHHSVHPEDSLWPPLSAVSMGTLSPRTIPGTNASSSVTTAVSSRRSRKERGDEKLGLLSPAKPPRLGSFFDAFRFRGSNYTDEIQKQEEDAQKLVRYKHVPQVAAQQFARTTTVEPLTQKASPKRGMRPVPGPHSMTNGTMSLQEYNRQYRRAQSLCSGRPAGANSFSKLTSTAELNEGSARQRRQSARGSVLWNGNKPELSRRMSTGNMWAKSDPQSSPPFRRDSTGVVGFQGNSASSMRRGSASSSGFSDASSPFVRESGPTTPFKQEFGSNIPPNRRGSEQSAATSGSRRGSFVNVPNPQHAAEIHRVDWSQSDQPVKLRQDSKWGGLKHRKTSVSQQKLIDEKETFHATETGSQSSDSPKSPKPGFLKRFTH
ncbi:hypothetical protein F53441_1796 [Fusarium austroafricanum]|uniref:Uncharacterized protein n=1 Tax=Fusarium austroafricanum TaxID=2364996 RepID=A0A8H4KVD2_9HYPO|nr:hypothetical protein F53441_1796 [Fusarium austroafricanum]